MGLFSPQLQPTPFAPGADPRDPSESGQGVALGGGAPPMTPITAVQMPQFAQPPEIPGPQKAPGLLGRIGRAVSNNLFHAPSGLGDLVTPDEQKAARAQGLLSLGIALSQGTGENPLASLGRGLQSAQAGYQGALQNTVAQKQQAIQQQQMQAQQQKLKLHAQLAQQFAAQPNETTEQSIARLSRYASAMASFDPESAAKLGDTVSKLREPQGAAPHTIDLKDRALTVDRAGNVLRDDKYGESATDRRVATTAGNAEKRATATATRDERRQENIVVNAFNNAKPVKDFQGAEAAYAVLNAARGSTGRNFMRPMAALDAFARMLNPQGAVRVGTLQILKDQGALTDKFVRKWDMLAKGEWPAGMMNELYDMADNIMSQHAEDFDHYREETVGRAEAQGLDPVTFDKILYKRRKNDPKQEKSKSTGKLGSYN